MSPGKRQTAVIASAYKGTRQNSLAPLSSAFTSSVIRGGGWEQSEEELFILQ